MVEDKKIAVAACTGMSPNGLIARTAVSDMAVDFDEIISICLGATAADNEKFLDMVHNFNIISLNGCESHCVDKILKGKKGNIVKSLDIDDILDGTGHSPNDVARLDEEGEICVSLVKDAMKNTIENL